MKRVKNMNTKLFILTCSVARLVHHLADVYTCRGQRVGSNLTCH